MASSETRGKKVEGDHLPTQTDTADGFTKALQKGETAVWDTTTVMMLRRASEKRLQSQDDGHESKRCMRSHAQC